ncbi:hypothetical protein KAR91_37480 [Candidatus Pacearchaeota archaeon]|nr:hypothetical protein [Candidatus Pacearchaeota archaeon]
MMRAAILRDNHPESSLKWEIACQKNQIDYLAIDMLRGDWLDLLYSFSPSFCLSRPPGEMQNSKKVFDEKIFYIENYTVYPVFPGFIETYIYENKASLAWFLKTNGIPHASTFISSSYDESLQYAKKAAYPFVAKTLIGAAGLGVKIIESKSAAKAYVRQAFSTGIKRRFGPNRKTGSPRSWLIKAIVSPGYFLNKLKQYHERNKDVQKGVVLFQHFIPHDFEWRCVKIGKSYFAYKKLKIGDKASGSSIFAYGPPPLELLDFTRELCSKNDFNFMAVDLFQNNNGIYVNELQTIFGHKNPYICKVENKPGRYVFQNNQWIFEPGNFNANESYDLRLKVALDLYREKK